MLKKKEDKKKVKLHELIIKLIMLHVKVCGI